MGTIRILDVTDLATFERVPPCADPAFDHRSCDYWEDADRGSKAARPSWLKATARDATSGATARPRPANPFLADLEAKQPAANPFATAAPANPFLTPGEDDEVAGPVDNPFAPKPPPKPAVEAGAPRKLQLLGRGLGVAGSYAKVLLADDAPTVYAQFGPLTAYPRAQRTRDLYPSLPESPLPGGHHLHRHDRRCAPRRSCHGPRRRGLRRPRRARVQRGRDLPGDRRRPRRDERRHARVLGVGRVPAGHR